MRQACDAFKAGDARATAPHRESAAPIIGFLAGTERFADPLGIFILLAPVLKIWTPDRDCIGFSQIA
jgi:hypothetical protein